MHTPEPHIVIQRFTEAHLEGVAALYNEPAVCRQVLQMPFQSVEAWRNKLVQEKKIEGIMSDFTMFD
jgi:putative acetyltransferase